MKTRPGRISLLIVILALTFSSLTGCVTNTDTAVKDTETIVSSEETQKQSTLKVIHWRVEDEPYYKVLNEKFEKEYPNIKVEMDLVPTKDYNQVRLARIAVGELDVFGSGDGELKTMGIRAAMMDITGQKFLESYVPGALDMGKYQGKQLLLPVSQVGMTTFYNKKIFEENGLKIPTTWTEFINVCETLKGKDITPIIFGGKDQWPVNMIVDSLELPIVRGNNPEFWGKLRSGETSLDSAEWVEVWSKLEILGKYMIKDFSGIAYGQVPGMFAQGKAAMLIDGTWSAAQIIDAKPAFEVGAFNLPASDDASKNQMTPVKVGGGYAVYVRTANKDASFKYLEFLSRKDMYQMFINMTKQGPVQPNVEVENSPLITEMNALASNQTILMENLLIPGMVWDAATQGMAVLVGKSKPEEAAKKSQEDAQASKSKWEPEQ